MFFNIYISIIDSYVDKMLYDVNELADCISDIMAFYYSSMFNNLSNLCFSDQVNYLKKYYFFNKFYLVNAYFLL